MRSGIVCLLPIYKLLEQEAKPAVLLKLSGKNPPGRTYTEKCEELMERVPADQGFYLWGCYDKKSLWQNIYIGKAGLGKTASLHSRILEELKDERCFAWRPFATCIELHEIRMDIHSGKYESDWERALRKEASTHIVWVAAPNIPDSDVLRIESDLIESMNPRANIRRPAPPKGVWQEDTKRAFGLLRKQIHLHRESKFALTLKT